jgi:hypothetical protein
MRSRTVTANSAGTFTYSPWIVLSHLSYDMNVGYTADPQQGATGTYSVQITEASPDYFRKAQFSRTTTTLTVTCVDGDFHGLVAGDGVNIRCSGSTGWDTTNGFSLQLATATNTTVFTITVADSGPTSGVLEYAPLPIQDLTSYSAVSGRKQGTIVGAAAMVRIAKVSGSLDGKVNLTVTQAGY